MFLQIKIFFYTFFLTSFLFCQNNSDLLYNISDRILSEKGNYFDIIWYYKIDNKDWEGKGNLKIYGKNYLYLELPYMEVLIQKSLISIKYNKEDQVILDYFNRKDSSNILSILLNEFDGFLINDLKVINDDIKLSLVPQNEVGFDFLYINTNSKDYVPKSIRAISGNDLEINVKVLSYSDLKNPSDIINKTLIASEMIDLRE